MGIFQVENVVLFNQAGVSSIESALVYYGVK